MEQAKLMVHRGATRVTREELAHYEPPEATATWKPIKHAHVVDCLYEELDRRQIGVTHEEYAVQRKGNYLFGVMTLNYLKTDEFAAALAFRHSNDMQEAMKMYAGVRVFACDNMALSGSELILHKKHSKHFSLVKSLPEAFDRYQDGALQLQREIDELKESTISRDSANRRIFDIFRRKIVPIRLFHPVIEEWYATHPHRDDLGTEWALLNAFTTYTKKLAPGPEMRATVRLGNFFGLGRKLTTTT
jgi:hypothetical protein